MELLEIYSTENAKFYLLKLLFIKVRCLVNVNKMYGLLRSVWSNLFWYVKVYMFLKFIQYTLH